MLKPHPIQQQILTRLTKLKTATFTELHPVDVQSNLYTYHLKYLQGNRLITKADPKTYALTETGKHYAKALGVTASTKKKPAPTHQIHVSVLLEDLTGQAKIISQPLTIKDDRIADLAYKVTQIKLSQQNLTQEKLSQPIHIGDAHIKFLDANNRPSISTLHHIFYQKSTKNLSKIKSDLPEEVVQEILFVKNGADGHFFFERSYQLPEPRGGKRR